MSGLVTDLRLLANNRLSSRHNGSQDNPLSGFAPRLVEINSGTGVKSRHCYPGQRCVFRVQRRSC